LINGAELGVETKRQIVFMPTDDFLFGWMKVKQVINFYEDFYPDFDRAKALEYLSFMELTEDTKVGTLSTGMKARLKLVVTMARNASLYLLDEPLNGIDPISRERIINMIVSGLNEESTMIISSYLVSELETILDEVIFLDKGTVVLAGNAEKFRMESFTQFIGSDFYAMITGHLQAEGIDLFSMLVLALLTAFVSVVTLVMTIYAAISIRRSILAEKKFGGFLSLMVFLLLGWLIGKITEFIFFVFFKLGLLVESSFNFILKPFKAERVQSAIDKIIG